MTDLTVNVEKTIEAPIEKVFDALQTHKPKQGIFYNGQLFDAYKFVIDLINRL